MIRALLVIVPLVALVTPALAEGEHANTSMTFHGNAGVELVGGGGTFQYGVRGHLGLALIRDTGGALQPTLSLGATLGAGTLDVDDPRALEGAVSIGYADYGPELQLGLRLGRKGFIRNRLFASVAYLRTDVDRRLALDAVGDVGAGGGFRAAIGFNWARAWGQVLAAKPASSSGGSDAEGEEVFAYIGKVFWFAIPQQAEIGWIQSAGSNRVGVTLSWGL